MSGGPRSVLLTGEPDEGEQGPGGAETAIGARRSTAFADHSLSRPLAANDASRWEAVRVEIIALPALSARRTITTPERRTQPTPLNSA
jgi:hypothetical protein